MQRTGEGPCILHSDSVLLCVQSGEGDDTWEVLKLFRAYMYVLKDGAKEYMLVSKESWSGGSSVYPSVGALVHDLMWQGDTHGSLAARLCARTAK